MEQKELLDTIRQFTAFVEQERKIRDNDRIAERELARTTEQALKEKQQKELLIEVVVKTIESTLERYNAVQNPNIKAFVLTDKLIQLLDVFINVLVIREKTDNQILNNRMTACCNNLRVEYTNILRILSNACAQPNAAVLPRQ
jgi:hypothetical protein